MGTYTLVLLGLMMSPVQVSRAVPAGGDPLSSVGLGTDVTVILVMAPDCAVCKEEIGFYKTLLVLPKMDGKTRRVAVLAQKGVMPVGRVIDDAKFKPHILTSGPYLMPDLPEPTVIILDALGKRLGTWEGQLTEVQRRGIVAVVLRSDWQRVLAWLSGSRLVLRLP